MLSEDKSNLSSAKPQLITGTKTSAEIVVITPSFNISRSFILRLLYELQLKALFQRGSHWRLGEMRVRMDDASGGKRPVDPRSSLNPSNSPEKEKGAFG